MANKWYWILVLGFLLMTPSLVLAKPFNYSIMENFGGSTALDRIANWSALYNDSNDRYNSFTALHSDNQSTLPMTSSGLTGNQTKTATAGTGSLQFNMTMSTTDGFKRYGRATNFTGFIGGMNLNYSVNQAGRSHNISFMAVNLTKQGSVQLTAWDMCIKLVGAFCGQQPRVLYICKPMASNFTGVPPSVMNNNLNKTGIKQVNLTGYSSAETFVTVVNQSIISLAQRNEAWGASCSGYNITKVIATMRVNAQAINATYIVNVTGAIDELIIYKENFEPETTQPYTNLTNATESTGEKFNSSILVFDDDNEKVNVTMTLFINNVSNSTVQLLGNYANNTNVTYTWNNTNITANDIIEIQFNASDGFAPSNYINTSRFKINTTFINSAPVLTFALVNYTNATFFKTAKNLNFSITGNDSDSGDKANYTLNVFVNKILNFTHQNYTSMSANTTFSFIVTGMNWSFGDNVTGQFNSSDGTDVSNYINSSIIMINHTISSLSQALLNETDNTLYRFRYLLASVTVSNSDGDKSNVSAVSFVNNNKKQTITQDNIMGAISFSFPNNWGREDTVTFMFNGTDNSYEIPPINTSILTVNFSFPVSNISNSSVQTNQAVNITNLNLTSKFSDLDDIVYHINHTNIVWNESLKISSIVISNETHILNVTLIGLSNGYVQVNITSIDNETQNITESFRLFITPNIVVTISRIYKSNGGLVMKMFIINFLIAIGLLGIMQNKRIIEKENTE